MLTQLTQIVALGLLKLIPPFWGKPRIGALLSSYLYEVQDLEGVLWDVLNERDVRTADLVRLKVIGDLVGQPYKGESLAAYRSAVQARIRANRSLGLALDVREVAHLILDTTSADAEIWLWDAGHAAIEMVVAGVMPDVHSALRELLKDARAGGVNLAVYTNAGDDTARHMIWDDATSFDFDDNLGSGSAYPTFEDSGTTTDVTTPVTDAGSIAIFGGKAIVADISSEIVYQFTIDALGDLTYDSVSFDLNTLTPVIFDPVSMQWNDDGTVLYVLDRGSDNIRALSASTPGEITGLTDRGDVFDVSSFETVPQAFTFGEDYTRLYVTGTATDSIHYAILTTPGDLDTASLSASYDHSTVTTFGDGLVYDAASRFLYLLNSGSGLVHGFVLPNDPSLTGIAYVGDVATVVTSAQDIALDGDNLWVMGPNATDVVYGFSKATVGALAGSVEVL